DYHCGSYTGIKTYIF
nr:immunoglobulin light chain junction region [Macaca mulatta]MOX81687.1 immunoglobulin light chain junction region [Macaca mulatta]MOX83597.1 immunoglobulin light chain junction region [Macaca mulatta]